MLLHTYITQDHYLHLKKDNEELYVHEHIARQQFAVVLLIEVQMKDFSSKPDVSARWVIPARLDHVYKPLELASTHILEASSTTPMM